MSKYRIHQGDCLEYMKTIPNNYVDAVITDPPYGLKFMGKKWDYDVPATEIWQECYRILKPGGHLLSFGGTRTYHRVVINIEDAGFEIRDMIAWIYGQGFPKSHNISKALDKMAGAEREIVGIQKHPTSNDRTGDKSPYQADNSHLVAEFPITAPATEEAKQWDGWGTALKPAIEPICLARKPLEGTVAKNILKYGTGGINIDGCRVSINPEVDDKRLGGNGKWKTDKMAQNTYEGGYSGNNIASSSLGRFPANVIHDGSEVVVKEFPQSKGGSSNGNAVVGEQSDNIPLRRGTLIPRNDDGSAARFFYCAKASKKDRDEGLDDLENKLYGQSGGAQGALSRGEKLYQEVNNASFGMNVIKIRKNNHPTVKPTELMRYLCKLITPPNGIIIDPFMGSGSTGKAAMLEEFRFIGCELDEGYFEIAKRRIANAQKNKGAT